MASPIPDQSAWQAWHPHELAQRLQGIAQPWCVVGGWALDLWHGQVTRAHEDLEFTVLRRDLPVFCQRMRELGLALYTAHGGVLSLLAAPSEQGAQDGQGAQGGHGEQDGQGEHGAAGELPAAGIAQIWCWDAAASCWRVDMMIEEGTPSTWVYKRSPDLTRDRKEAVWRGALGDGPRLPYLSPAAVLLFKAKQRRDKDQADFERALPHLPQAEREWLRQQLTHLHPGHAWLQAL